MTNDPIQTAASFAESTLRAAERDIMNARSFDAKRHAANRTAALTAIEQLRTAAADHAALADLGKRIAEMAAQADEIVVAAIRQPIDGYQKAAARELASFASNRESRVPEETGATAYADKQQAWATKIRDLLDAARDQLGSERGQAFVAELEGWIATTEQTAAELRFLGEAFELFRAKAATAAGEIGFVRALDSVEKNFEDSPERVVQSWDAAKRLVARFEEPRFAEVPEVAKQLARYRALEQRVAAELAPRLLRVRAAPLVETANRALEYLKRGTDERNERTVLEARAQLRAGIAPLVRDFQAEPTTRAFLDRCTEALARSERELGDPIVIRELEQIERFVVPLVERVERGLAMKSIPRVVEHAPRLAARVVGLAPLLAHQRARLLHERAVAALARIAPELGEPAARAVAEAEALPRFAIDITADVRVQGVLAKLNRELERYHDEYVKAQEMFEDRVDLDAGTSPGVTRTVLGDIESATRSLIAFARAAEALGGELRAVDGAHPVAHELADLAPRLVARAQDWKARLATRCEYVNAIDTARIAVESANRPRAEALEGGAPAMHAWPDVLARMKYADDAVAAAVAILPDAHDEADVWAARAAAMRREALESLAAVCVTEATRLAVAGNTYEAEQFATALRTTAPDAPENALIAAAIAGTADARQQARAELEARAALLRTRAEAAARAARPTYDAWVAERKPIVALAGSIVGNLEQHRGAWVVGSCSHLGIVLADEPGEINGETYQIDYDPAVRTQLFADMQRMNDLYAGFAQRIYDAHGVPGVTTTAHYPREAHFACEIVGTAEYTPRREVRGPSGDVIGTVDGTPYPVPRVAIRAVATSYFVIVPGHSPSFAALDVSGLD